MINALKVITTQLKSWRNQYNKIEFKIYVRKMTVTKAKSTSSTKESNNWFNWIKIVNWRFLT